MMRKPFVRSMAGWLADWVTDWAGLRYMFNVHNARREIKNREKIGILSLNNNNSHCENEKGACATWWIYINHKFLFAYNMCDMRELRINLIWLPAGKWIGDDTRTQYIIILIMLWVNGTFYTVYFLNFSLALYSLFLPPRSWSLYLLTLMNCRYNDGFFLSFIMSSESIILLNP